jgi:hypothetical protein
MTSLVNISAVTNTLRLDDKRQSETRFTVFNSSGRPLLGRVLIVPQNPISNDWFTIVGPTEQDFAIAGTHQYVVRISVPPTAPAGSYPFRLDLVDVSLPDENLTKGPTVIFEVPAPEPQKKNLPIWIPIAVIMAVLVLGGGIAALVVPGIIGRSEATPVPIPTLTFTNTPTIIFTNTPTPTFTNTPMPTFTNTPTPTFTNTPTAIPPLIVTGINMSASPPSPGKKCGLILVDFDAVISFTGSGTANYEWSATGEVPDSSPLSGSLTVSCDSSPCTKSVRITDIRLNVPNNGAGDVSASIRVDASNSRTATDVANYTCGTLP